jgi:hypothetical protein
VFANFEQRTIGFEDVDCYWRWHEMTLLTGGQARTNEWVVDG